MSTNAAEKREIVRHELVRTALVSLGIGLVTGSLIGALFVEIYLTGRTTAWTLFGSVCVAFCLFGIAGLIVSVLLGMASRRVALR